MTLVKFSNHVIISLRVTFETLTQMKFMVILYIGFNINFWYPGKSTHAPMACIWVFVEHKQLDNYGICQHDSDFQKQSNTDVFDVFNFRVQ